MKKIEELFKGTAANYNKSRPHIETCNALVEACLDKLSKNAKYQNYFRHQASDVKTDYSVFKAGGAISRPVASAKFEPDAYQFGELAKGVLKILAKEKNLSDGEIESVDRCIYTSVIAVAAVYDLWKPGSRKTPGTFFEMYMAGLMKTHLPKSPQSKHVNLGAMLGDDTKEEERVALQATGDDEEDEESSVSTDLVITSTKRKKHAVIPLKITTRERVVQPFAHQRILQSSFPDQFHSFLCCISETQLDKKAQTVKQICVPGTIRLFQKFLSKLEGLYYCDAPGRYLQPNLTRTIPVNQLGKVFNDVRKLLED